MDKQKANLIVKELSLHYLNTPALVYSTAFELLIAVMLSAQCTDKRVNIVTKELFKTHNTAQAIITLTQQQLEQIIKPCGLFKTKAKHILSASKDILQKFNGQVPNNLADLQTLAGVGRKTANVVYSVFFGGNAIAVDTHVFRVSNRIGLASSNNVLQTEKQLMNIIDEDKWSSCHHYLIYLGRDKCKATKGCDCTNCFINSLCEKHL